MHGFTDLFSNFSGKQVGIEMINKHGFDILEILQEA